MDGRSRLDEPVELAGRLIRPGAVLIASGASPAVPPIPGLAGSGYLLASLADALLLRLTVELRNAGLALVDFLRQAVTLAGVAALVAAGSSLTPVFAGQIGVGIVLVAIAPLLVGAGVRLRRPENQATLHFFWLTVAFCGVMALSFAGRHSSIGWSEHPGVWPGTTSEGKSRADAPSSAL